jgi:Cytochrome P450
MTASTVRTGISWAAQSSHGPDGARPGTCPGYRGRGGDTAGRRPGRRRHPRYARAGLRIADVTIRPDDLVLLDNGAANHDRTAFVDPERFDISRPAVPHLSFGHGARYCIGAPLARIELQSVFSQLVRGSRACA